MWRRLAGKGRGRSVLQVIILRPSCPSAPAGNRALRTFLRSFRRGFSFDVIQILHAWLDLDDPCHGRRFYLSLRDRAQDSSPGHQPTAQGTAPAVLQTQSARLCSVYKSLSEVSMRTWSFATPITHQSTCLEPDFE